MTFAHPKMLWLLAVALPLLALFFWWSWRRRQFLVSQFVRSRLLAHLTVGLSTAVQKTRMLLLVLAVGVLIVALAGPQWGLAWEEASQRGLDVVVAIDTSRSMLAEDILPNRLERAKLAALDLMNLARRDRLALVAFAGTAFLQCPLTVDDEAFRQSVSQLDVRIMPQGGTALADAIETAQSAFKVDEDNHRALVLFTDGEDHDGGALEAAEKAARAGLRIFTVGVGTANGELLRVPDEQGNLAYVKDAAGNVVKSRLDETLLTRIANAGNGFYLPMTGAKTVDVLYERGLAPLPTSEIATRMVRQQQQRYQWPLALAMLLLLAEIFLPDRKKVRRTEATVMASNPELRKMVALLVLFCLPLQVIGSPASALRLFREGRYDEAYQEYARLLERRPDDARLQYNAGTAAYKAEDYAKALQHFSAAARTPDLQIQQRAAYNLGNSHYYKGALNPQDRRQAWEQALKQFEAARTLDPADADAEFNHDLVKRKLEELKQQQQQQKPQDNQEGDQQEQDSGDQDQPRQDGDSQDSESERPQPDPEQDGQEPQEQPDPRQGDPQDQDEQENNAQQPKEGDDPPDEKSSSQPGEQSNEDSKASGQDADSAAVPGQMTPEQVKQLLDSQKGNEKALIFLPPDKPKQRKQAIRDW